MLEGILKGLLQWLYALILEIVEYITNGLLEVFSMNLGYFEAAAPVARDMVDIIIACGWALLLGNLVFQAAKTMLTGLGFEGEDPRLLFARTFVFGFLLLCSRQICEIGLGLSGTVVTLLRLPDAVTVSLPGENLFTIGASWLLVIIIGLVLMFQIIKLFFSVGERYVVVGFLTLMAPLAFAMGGSKSTADIFKGWVRMFASMCLMMVLNVVFLKLLLSAMGNMPSDAGMLPWVIFVVAIARVGRKADDMIMRIGLNPAMTGHPLGSRIPGMLSAMVVRSVASTAAEAVKSATAGKQAAQGGTPPAGAGRPEASVSTMTAKQSGSPGQNASRMARAYPGTAGTPIQSASSATFSHISPGTEVTGQITRSHTQGVQPAAGTAGTSTSATTLSQSGASPHTQGSPGTAGTPGMSAQQHTAQSPATRRSAAQSIGRPGTAGAASQPVPGVTTFQAGPGTAGMGHSDISSRTVRNASPGTAGKGRPDSDSTASKAARYTGVPPGLRGSLGRRPTLDTVGTSGLQTAVRLRYQSETASQNTITHQPGSRASQQTQPIPSGPGTAGKPHAPRPGEALTPSRPASGHGSLSASPSSPAAPQERASPPAGGQTPAATALPGMVRPLSGATAPQEGATQPGEASRQASRSNGTAGTGVAKPNASGGKTHPPQPGQNAPPGLRGANRIGSPGSRPGRNPNHPNRPSKGAQNRESKRK